jgi:proline utilization trans-activator
VRMAQSHGLHTNMQASTVGDQLVRRGRRIWWTVYTLDRKLSSSMGVPNALRDEDISTSLAVEHGADVDTVALAIHVRICQLLGKVINSKSLFP